MFPESRVLHQVLLQILYQQPEPDMRSDSAAQHRHDDMVLMAREISKRIEDELEYPGQIKVNVIRESRVVDYAK